MYIFKEPEYDRQKCGALLHGIIGIGSSLMTGHDHD